MHPVLVAYRAQLLAGDFFSDRKGSVCHSVLWRDMADLPLEADPLRVRTQPGTDI